MQNENNVVNADLAALGLDPVQNAKDDRALAEMYPGFERNSALGTGLHASEASHAGLPAGQMSVVAGNASEPKSAIVGIDADGTIAVKDTDGLISNASIRKAAPEEVRDAKPKFATRDAGQRTQRARQGGSFKGKATDRTNDRKDRLPMRGGQMAAALGLALSGAGKTYEDFPKAPVKETRRFPKTPNARGPQKHGRFTGKANTTHRSVNRGK